MSLIAKEGGKDFAQVEAGNHMARCFGVIDLGTQENTMFGGFDRKIVLQFEFPTELIQDTGTEFDGQPYSLGLFFTLSLSEKSNLRPFLESWRGRAFTAEELEGFDIKNLLTAPLMASVIKDKKGKSVIASAAVMPKGVKCPPQFNPVRFFSTEDWEGFDDLPKGFQKIIKESTEWKAKDVEMGTPEETPPAEPNGSCTGQTDCTCPICDDIPF